MQSTKLMSRGGVFHKTLSWICSLTLALSMACPNASAFAAAVNSDTGDTTTEVVSDLGGENAVSSDASLSEATEGGETEGAEVADEAGEAADEAVEATDDIELEAVEAAEAIETSDAEAAEVVYGTMEAGQAWDGTTHDTSWYNTTAKEFTLTTAAQLAGLADITSPKNDYAAWQNGSRDSRAAGIKQDNFEGKTIKLGADIDLNNKLFDPISDLNNWGGGGQGVSGGTYSEVAWKGTFDGQGHTVKNLNVDGSVNCSTNFNGYQGLISAIGKNGVVKTLGVTGKVKARVGGGIVGVANTDEGSETSSTLTMTKAEWPKIMNCWANVDITGNGSGSRGCGGIFGGESDYRSSIYIINCYAMGDVANGTIGSAGGVSGFANGVVAGCYNLGDVSGAYVGSIVATLFSNTINTATYKGYGLYINNMPLSGSSDNPYRVSLDQNASSPQAPADAKFYTSAQIQAGAATLGSAYVADTDKKLNNGYPVLFWQAGGEYIDMSSATVADVADQSYTGQAIEPALTLTLDGKQLTENQDYYVVYENNINAGDKTAKATAYGMGRYTGQSATVTFSITQTDLSATTIDAVANTWSYGADDPAKPALTVKTADGITLVEGTDYTVTYANNVETGVATATISGANAGVKGTNSVSFNVVRAADSLKGSGTAEDPYQIGSKGELQFMAHQIYIGNKTYQYGNIIITADFDASAKDEKDLAADPLGAEYSVKNAEGKSVRYYNHYYGDIDGQGHTITLGLVAASNEHMALVAYAGSYYSASADDYRGLITYKNIIIAGSVSARYAAGIVSDASSYNDLLIENCVNKASISCNSGMSMYLAGIVAYSLAGITVKNCKNEGTITGDSTTTSDYCAGIVAYHNSSQLTEVKTLTIENCSNTADIKPGGSGAGILGNDQAKENMTIKNCYNTGNIISQATGDSGSVAGIAARPLSTGSCTGVLTVDGCYNTGNMQAGTAGGIVCSMSYGGGSITNCYNTGDTTSTAIDKYKTGNYGSAGILACDNVGSSSKVAGRTVTISGYSTGKASGGSAGAIVGALKSMVRSTSSTAANVTTWNISGSYLEGCAKSGIGANNSPSYDIATLNDTTAVIADDALKAVPASLGSAFMADDGEKQLNKGYPVLYWQKDASALSLANATTNAIANQTYTMKQIKPAIENVMVGSNKLVEDADYKVTYTNNTDAGTATATLTGLGRYTGAKTLTFTILPADITTPGIGAKLDSYDLWTSATAAASPEPTVVWGTTALVKDTDYTLAYKNNTTTGKATLYINGIGNYTGTQEVSFNVTACNADKLEGSGTTSDPYIISNKDELEFFALAVQYGVGNYANSAVKVTADIDATATDGRPALDPIGLLSASTRWEPKASEYSFAGIFDGDGHTITVSNTLFGRVDDTDISNLTIEGSVEGSNIIAAALVSVAGGTCTIDNCINNAAVSAKGSNATGGLVGLAAQNADLTITNSKNNGAVSGGREIGGVLGCAFTNATINIENCFNTADVISSGYNNVYAGAGGILGRANLGQAGSDATATVSIALSGNTGKIQGSHAGGIMGLMEGKYQAAKLTICDVYNTGDVVTSSNNTSSSQYYGAGGILGTHDNGNQKAVISITNAYNAGKISKERSTARVQLGGVLGCLRYNAADTLDNCYYLEDGTQKSIGYIASNSQIKDNSVKVTDAELKATGESGMAAKLGAAFSDDVAGVNAGYPVLEKTAVELSTGLIKQQYYTGCALKPAVTVYNTSVSPKAALVEGSDYVLAYDNNTQVGTASVTIVGIGAYEGATATTSFEIVACPLSRCTVAPTPAQIATGSAIEPALEVTNAAGATLTQGVDYTVGFANNTEIGIAKYVIVGKGGYTGVLSGTFQIVGQTVATAEATFDTVHYTGSDLTSSVKAGMKVKDADKNTLVEGTDYTVSFEDANGAAVSSIVEKGTYTAVITGIGNYTGVLRASFDVTPYLSIYQKVDGGEAELVKEYTEAELVGMAKSGSVSVLYTKGGWSVSTATSYIELASLFSKAGIKDNCYAEGASVEFASGSFKVSQSYTELETGKFYPATTSSAIDEKLEGETVPAVLAFQEASSAIAEGATAADAASANAAAANSNKAPRILSGASEDDYKAGSVAGRRFVSNVDTITITYDSPVIFKVQVLYKGSTEPKVVKSYTEKDLWDIKSKGDPVSGMFWKGDVWKVTTTSEYVTFADLFADAGVGSLWTSGATLKWGGDDPTAPQKAAQSISYDDLMKRCYFFPSASGANSDNPGNNKPAPPVLSLTEYSCSTGGTEAVDAAAAETYNIEHKNVNNFPRVVWGIPMDEYTGEDHSGARGMYYWSNNTYLTIATDEVDPDSAFIERLSGDTRYDTMAKISSTGFDSAENVVIATGENFPDALSASALAGTLNAPVILTESNELSEAAEQEIERLGAKNAYVLGGESAESSAVVAALKDNLGLNVERIAGDTRQGTAVKIGEVVAQKTEVSTVIVSSGTSPWDALSVSPYSYAKTAPIYLTESDGTLSDATAAAIKATGATNVVIVGGASAVAESVTEQLAGLTCERWSGADRYATCAEIVKHELEAGMTIQYAAVATGLKFPDALAGGALCGANNSIMLMTDGTSTDLLDSIIVPKKDELNTLYLLGGTSSISQEFEDYANKELL